MTPADPREQRLAVRNLTGGHGYDAHDALLSEAARRGGRVPGYQLAALLAGLPVKRVLAGLQLLGLLALTPEGDAVVQAQTSLEAIDAAMATRAAEQQARAERRAARAVQTPAEREDAWTRYERDRKRHMRNPAKYPPAVPPSRMDVPGTKAGTTAGTEGGLSQASVPGQVAPSDSLSLSPLGNSNPEREREVSSDQTSDARDPEPGQPRDMSPGQPTWTPAEAPTSPARPVSGQHAADAQVDQVVAHLDLCLPGTATLLADRRAVRARLDEGLTVDDLCAIVDGANSGDRYYPRIRRTTLGFLLGDNDRVSTLLTAGRAVRSSRSATPSPPAAQGGVTAPPRPLPRAGVPTLPADHWPADVREAPQIERGYLYGYSHEDRTWHLVGRVPGAASTTPAPPDVVPPARCREGGGG